MRPFLGMGLILLTLAACQEGAEPLRDVTAFEQAAAGGRSTSADGSYDHDTDHDHDDCPKDDECERWMTGGGSLWVDDVRVTHGFVLRCDLEHRGQNLQINWDGNRFHLEELERAECVDSPEYDPEVPDADWDTLIAEGTGRLNGAPASVELVFIDDGEPGEDDIGILVIRDEGGDVVLEVESFLEFGNHQAHTRCPPD